MKVKSDHRSKFTSIKIELNKLTSLPMFGFIAKIRKSTLTLVTLPSFSISGEISAEKMYVESRKIYRRLYDWGYALYPQSYKRL